MYEGSVSEYGHNIPALKHVMKLILSGYVILAFIIKYNNKNMEIYFGLSSSVLQRANGVNIKQECSSKFHKHNL